MGACLATSPFWRQTGSAELGGRLQPADIRLVIGTRPEAIKLAPVAHALAARGLPPSLIVTGQHGGLDLAAFGLTEFAALRLDCPGKPDPHAHVRDVEDAILRAVGGSPDLIVVQGDTSSALGGARAAAALGIPLAHVEAGLRSHDPALPWPEEGYRVAIDAASDLLFAPTSGGADNLRREGVDGEIHVTGNTSVDALLEVERRLPSPGVSDSGSPRILVTCHRRESWEAGLGGVMAAVRELAGRGDARFHVLLHPNSHVSAHIRGAVGECPNVTLIEPCGHAEMIQHMRRSTLVLSDSGGIQEEAPSLGIPLLVLREKTERPEGLATGNMRLVGTDTMRIVASVEQLLADPVARAAMSRRTYPYGDGNAGPRIAAIVVNWLASRSSGRLQRA